MSYFEEEYKKRFKGAQSLGGIDPDQIWQGVSKELSDDVVSPLENRTNRGKYYRYLLLSLLLLVSAGLFFLLTNEDQAARTSESKAPIAIKKTDLSINSTLQLNKNQSSVFSEQTTEQVDATTNASVGKDPVSSQSIPSLHQSIEKKLAHSSSNKLLADPLTPVVNTTSGHQGNTKQTSNHSAQKNTKVEAAPSNQLDNNSYKKGLFTTLELNPKTSELKNNYPYKVKAYLQDDLASLIIPLKKDPDKLSIGWSAGANWLSNFYQKDNESPDFNKTLKEAHKGEPGYTTSLLVRWETAKNIHFSTGIEYNSTATEFNMVQQYDTLMFRDNNPNGDLINALATRTVRHHNRQNYLSIPLLVGFSKRYGKINWGADIGMGFNFVINQKGKSLNYQNVILDYESAAAVIPYQKQFLSYQINPFVAYQWSTKIAIQLRPSFRFQDHRYSDFFALRHSSFYSGVNIGVFYTGR